MAIVSMTGFGRFQGADALLSQTWEIRSVNSRVLDLKWKLPAQARGMEARLEKMVRRHAARGRVEISLTMEMRADAPAFFDTSKAAAMLSVLEAFAASRGDVFRPDYAALLALPQLWISDSENGQEADELTARLEAGLQSALEDWNLSRRGEGENLQRDLAMRFMVMEEWVRRIEERAPSIKQDRFAVVRQRLNDMLAAWDGPAMDDARFMQEMVILADRLDVSEELTRLRSHLERLQELLNVEEGGRKMDFTLQECFREINTCGNKIQDAALSRLVVDFKNELEKCREQAQNLE